MKSMKFSWLPRLMNHTWDKPILSPLLKVISPVLRSLRRRYHCIAAGVLFAISCHGAPKVTEYQVKALFLFNFIKYVEWPEETFSNHESPIVIGVVGKNPFDGLLQNTVEDKRQNGRNIIVKQIERNENIADCHLLFIPRSYNSSKANILEQLKGIPVLTIGEREDFIKDGGIINFVIKKEQVRLEINLLSSRMSKLRISSRLLSVADVVKE